VKQEGKPLKDANVQFGFWKDNQTKHTYIDAKETDAGTYVSNLRFPSAGNYHVKLHVEKDHIHDHHEISVEVK
jgi:hypothetical protein